MNDLKLSFRPIQSFLAKHHAVLFICLIASLLAVSIYSLYDVTLQAQVSSSSQPVNNLAKFDQETIDKIKSLHTSTDTSEALAFPSKRFNPFVE